MPDILLSFLSLRALLAQRALNYSTARRMQPPYGGQPAKPRSLGVVLYFPVIFGHVGSSLVISPKSSSAPWPPSRAQRGTTKHDKMRQNTPKHDNRIVGSRLDPMILPNIILPSISLLGGLAPLAIRVNSCQLCFRLPTSPSTHVLLRTLPSEKRLLVKKR